MDDPGATTPNIQIPERQRTAPAQKIPASSPQGSGKIPTWIWIVLALFLFLFSALILFFYFFIYPIIFPPSFTLVIRNAEPGSSVSIDGETRGITKPDGSITIDQLRAGVRVGLVQHNEFEDFPFRVDGQRGEEAFVTVSQKRKNQQSEKRRNEIEMNGPMLLIIGGTFPMGSDSGHANERPVHEVTVADFYIDKFEVTNEQYRKYCDETKTQYPENPWWDRNYFDKNPDSPVIVNWEEATRYAKWAKKRLPTEQEWEMAAAWDPTLKRKRVWPWGDSAEMSVAQIKSSRTTPVGRHPQGVSFFGVHDMAGNVAEWVSDSYKPYPGSQESDPNYSTDRRVVRGGAFPSPMEDAKTTRRLHASPSVDKTGVIGFRCALSADDPALQNLP
jgi:formylglycine-generating enzyme required for sulfatase activity